MVDSGANWNCRMTLELTGTVRLTLELLVAEGSENTTVYVRI